MAHESSPQGGLGEDDGGPPRDGSDTRAEAVLGVGKSRDEAGAVKWKGSLRGSPSIPADMIASGPPTERIKGNKAAKRSKALKRKADIESTAGLDVTKAVTALLGSVAEAISKIRS